MRPPQAPSATGRCHRCHLFHGSLFPRSIYHAAQPITPLRGQQVPRRLQHRLEAGSQGGKKAVVHVYAGATAGVTGHVHCLPDRPDIARACPWPNTLHIVVPTSIEGRIGHV